MVFSSFIFLIFFLPFTVIVYFILGHKYRNLFLLVMSIIFYAWGSPQYTLVMVGIIIINYICGLFIDKYDKSDRLIAKKRSLIIGVCINLLVLIIFKYTNFFVANLNYPLQWFEFDPIFIKSIVLPIGISFYIFQSISYIVDVYRKNAVVQKNFTNLALYVAMFPQLVAGPIVRYNTIAAEIESERRIPLDKIVLGFHIVILGLGKKILIANPMGSIADNIFGIPSAALDPLTAWVGAFVYALQLYFDFSGYSDMAIGLGVIFGFTFPVNFNYPYISTSITELWKRWHISLSAWFKDYLYIPLGGSRVKVSRMYLNMLIVFILVGVWHGANWTFLLFGLVNGAALVFEKITGLNKVERFKILRWAVTMCIWIFVGVVGRSDSVGYAFGYIGVMLGIGGGETPVINILHALKTTDIIMIIIAVFGSTPLFKKYCLAGLFDSKVQTALPIKALQYAFLLAVIFLCMVYLASSSYNPFIYFRF